MRYYDPNEPLVVGCDASCFGLGAAVFQSNGVIGYASRTLTATERNYAQIEKELLAILFACVKFDQIIVGNPMVTVKTDHKPLVNVFRKPLLSAPRRLQHMLLNLQRYNLRIEFVTGKDNGSRMQFRVPRWLSVPKKTASGRRPSVRYSERSKRFSCHHSSVFRKTTSRKSSKKRPRI